MLEVRDLSVTYKLRNTLHEALSDVSFSITEKEVYGLIGESGAGKSTIALSILRCLPENAQEKGGIFFQGKDLMKMPEDQLRNIWGKEISFVPQDALAALNPSITIGEQIEETLRYQYKMNRSEAKEISLQWLSKVRLANPPEIAAKYPHQLSGGMLQRVMLAMALCTNPRLVILDEPTSQLDVTTQGYFLSLLIRLINDQNLTVLYISHNLKLIKKICTRVGVLFAGELVEEGYPEDLFNNPYHPYTQTLLSNIVEWNANISSLKIEQREHVLSLESSLGSCRYLIHCPWAEQICHNHPPIEEIASQHKVRCFRWQHIQQSKRHAVKSIPVSSLEFLKEQPLKTLEQQNDKPFIKIENFSVDYPISILQSILSFHHFRRTYHRALNNATLYAYRDRTLGILGESGSGKTTLAKAVMGLIYHNFSKNSADALQLWVENTYIDLPQQINKRSPNILRKLQMTLQNLDESLNPHISVGEILERPLRKLLKMPGSLAKEKTKDLLRAVLLSEDYINRYPTQLSGGEKQRVSLARALASQPTLLICDEAFSALDTTVQAFILQLLYSLRKEYQLCLWVISHDLAVINSLADEMIVMLKGNIVERSTRGAFLQPPHHPYTTLLINAAKDVLLNGNGFEQTPFDNDTNGHENVGCFYVAHCPQRIALEATQAVPLQCYEVPPKWIETADSQKSILCHYPLE